MEEFSNPFDEEFDSKDVINKTEIATGIADKEIKDKKEPGFLKDRLTDEDLERIISYDTEKRKKISFKPQITEEIETSDEKFDVKNRFKDFFMAPKISGNGKLKGDAHIYPKGKIRELKKKVEITSSPNEKHTKHGAATVLINRDDTGDLDNIEIVCKCGETILLKFDILDNLEQEETKVINREIDEPTPFNEESEFKDIEKGILTEPEKVMDEGNINDEDIFLEEPEQNNLEKPEEDEWTDDFGVSEDELDLGDIDLSGI